MIGSRLLVPLLLTTSFAAPPALAQEVPPEVRLPLAQYEALMARARYREGPQPTWSTGNVDVRLPEGQTAGGFATVEARGDFVIVGDGTAEVLLLPGHVVLESARIDGNDATLVQRGGAYVALVEGGARHNVALTYQVPIQPASDGAALAVVPLPPLAGARLAVTGGGATVDVWPSGSVTSPAPNLAVQLPATPAAVVRWGAAGDLVRRVDYRLTIEPGTDGATVEARFEVDLEGPRATVPIAPTTIALTEVQEGGKPLPTRVVGDWHRAVVTGPGRHVIVAQLKVVIDRSEGQPQVLMPLPPAPIIRVEAKVPGNRSVELVPAVPVTLQVAGEGDDAVTTAVGHLPPSESVTVRWTEPRTAPEQVVSVNTETYQLVKIEEGVVRSKVEVRYEIIRGSIKELPIQLPDAAVLYKVVGEGIEDWRTFAATDSEPRQARVFLGAEREGTYRLELELEQVASQTVGQPVDIPIVRPLGVAREMGVVALFDGDKVGFAEVTPDGYVKSGEDALPIEVRQKLAGDIVSQAFKHIGQPGAVRSAVSAAKTRETRYDANIESLYTFQQNALTVNTSIMIEVKSGRTDRIVLSLPRDVKVGTDVSAPSLKKADWVDEPEGAEPGPRRDYEILLTRALEGTFHIELALELILGSDIAKLALPDIQVKEADVKKGSLGITSESGIEVTQASLTGLRKLDIAELPNSVKLHSRRDVQLGYGFSYVDEAWTLGLDVRRHRAVETLTARVMQAWIETTVFSEGQLVSAATFRVKNEGQQHLRVKLPEGARLLSVHVAGERAEPIADETGALKIQIPQKQESVVEVVCMVKRDALGFLSSVDLVAPRPDVFVTDLQWLVRVPSKLTVYGTSTELDERPADGYRSPPPRSQGELGIGLSTTDSVNEQLFVIDVLDATDANTLTVSLSTLSAPPALGIALLIVALLLLAFAIWKRTRRETRKSGYWPALLAGFALLVLRIVIWGMGGGEAIAFVAVLAVVALFAWIARRAEDAVGKEGPA